MLPKHASWYVLFGTNAMVLAYTDESAGAAQIGSDNWWRVLQRPGGRIGRPDYTIDPSGYRALMSLQLAELHYRQPGLAKRLLATMPERYVRHAEADLSALSWGAFFMTDETRMGTLATPQTARSSMV